MRRKLAFGIRSTISPAFGIGVLSILLFSSRSAFSSSLLDTDTPTGIFDQADLAQIPGILPIQYAPPDVVDGVEELAAEYDASAIAYTVPDSVGSPTLNVPTMTTPTGAGAPDAGISGSADPLQAPPPMDSGDPDPDRLTTPSLLMSVAPVAEVGQ